MSDTITFEEAKAIALEETDKAKNIDDLLYRITQRVYQKGKEDAAKHGEWMHGWYTSGHYYERCSECGTEIEETFFGNDYNVNFCPNCGARMDGET